MTSDAVEGEWLHILALGKLLYVIRADQISEEDFPWRLRPIPWIDIATDPINGFEELVAAITGNRKLRSEINSVTVYRRMTTSTAIDPRLVIDIHGRDEDLRCIRGLLGNGRPTFVTGIGGIGKSRLAYEIALTLAEVIGVIWHVCSETSTSDSIIELLKYHLKLPKEISTIGLMGRVHAEKVLIVIDNAESIQESGRRKSYIDLANSLCQAGAHVLLTSREMWDGLIRAQEHDLEKLTLQAAIDVCRAMCKLDNVILANEQMQDMTIKAHLHPRMIELAVTLCKRRGFDRTIKTLAELRGRTVEKALSEMILKTVEQMRDSDSTYGSLAVQTLYRLNVCRGGFTIRAAEALSIDPGNNHLPQNDVYLDEVLDVLQQWKFVRRDHERQRFNIDEMVVAAVGEDEGAYDAHFKFFKSLAMEYTRRDDFHGLEPDIENLTAAFNRKLEQGEIREAFFLCQNCTRLFFNRVRFEEWKDWLARLQPKIEADGDDELMAHFMEALGDSHAHTQTGNRTENLKSAISYYEKSLEYFTSREYAPKCIVLLHNIGLMYQMLFESERLVVHLKNAVSIYHGILQFQETSESAPTWSNLGLCLYRMGDLEDDVSLLERATEYFSKAIEISSGRGSVLRLANTLIGFADTHIALAKYRDPDENITSARLKYEYALQFATPESAPHAYSRVQFNRAKLNYSSAVRDQDPDLMRHAMEGFEEALRYCARERAPGQRAKILHALGLAHYNRGNANVAIRLWFEAKECFEMVSNFDSAIMVQDLIEQAENQA